MAKGRKPQANARGPEPAPKSRAALYWAIAVAAAAVLVYVNALGNDFVLDDIRLIRDNERIRALASIPHLFASTYWGAQGPQALYRPLVLASYALNYAVHGLDASGYIGVNIALHASVCLLLFALVRALGGSLLAAGLTGIAFAVHPIHTEAVAGHFRTAGVAGSAVVPGGAASASTRACRRPGRPPLSRGRARLLCVRTPVEGKRDDAAARHAGDGRARAGAATRRTAGNPAVASCAGLSADARRCDRIPRRPARDPRRYRHRRQCDRAARQPTCADHDLTVRRRARRDLGTIADDGVRRVHRLRAPAGVAGAPVAGLFLQSDSSRDERARPSISSPASH